MPDATSEATPANGADTDRVQKLKIVPCNVTEMLEQLGSKQVPVIAIFPAGNANHPIVLRGGYTQEMLLTALDDAGPSKTAHLSPTKTGIHRQRHGRSPSWKRTEG